MHTKLNNQIRKFLVGSVTMGFILSLGFGSGGVALVKAQGLGRKALAKVHQDQQALPGMVGTAFTLDGVPVSVQAVSLPSTDFTVSDASSASQVATSVSFKPFRELSITAIPFGTAPPTESLPIATFGGKTAYEDALRTARLQQGGNVQDGPTIVLFGQQITGLQTSLALYIDGPAPKPVMIDEWVVEAGERLWIVRWSQEQSPTVDSLESGNFQPGLAVSSSNLDQPSKIKEQPLNNSTFELNQNILAANLPTPAWWEGDCDNTTYSKGSGGIASYRLGAVYRGAPACGPRPYYDSGPDVLVRFYSGAWGEYEWECVEYS